MVSTETRHPQGEGVEEETCFYSPDSVAYWLESWGELQELALLTPPSSSRFRELTICGSGANTHDRLYHLHTICDLQMARVNLEPGSLEAWAVEAAMHGITFRQAEHDHRRRNGSIAEAYPRACRQMAESLGWRQIPGLLTTGTRNPIIIHELEESLPGGASK